MIRRRSFWAVAGLLASLCGCGGDDSTSISLSTTSIVFNADAGAAPPPAQTIHVTFKGDAVVIGYPSGTPEPTWLALSDLGHTATTADISLRATDTFTPGTRSTTLRFAIGKADGSQNKFTDVQVTLTVNGPSSGGPSSGGPSSGGPSSGAPPPSISISTAAVTFDVEQEGVLPAPQNVHLTFQGTGLAFDSSTTPAWLAVSETGRTSTTADYSFSVIDNTNPGTFSATLRFSVFSADGSQSAFADVAVTATVFIPFGVKAPSLTFSAVGGAAQPADPAAGYVVTVRGDRALWRASAPPWISLSAASGSGPAAVTVTASGDGLAVGTHRDQIQIVDDESGNHKSLNVTITVHAP